MTKDNLTFVIPCKNEEGYIERTLRSINSQKGIEGTLVIIADGGSTDSTLDIIKRIKKELSIKIKVIKGGSVSEGRNAGAKLVKTEFIVFVDADSVLIDDDIAIKTFLLIDEFDLITCKTKSISKSLLSKISFTLFEFVRSRMKETFSTGVYMAIRKSEFVELGGFDVTVHQSEDYLLSRKIPKARFNILNSYVGQDDRRFRRMGYFGMIRMLISNYINRDDEEHFRKNINYW